MNGGNNDGQWLKRKGGHEWWLSMGVVVGWDSGSSMRWEKEREREKSVSCF